MEKNHECACGCGCECKCGGGFCLCRLFRIILSIAALLIVLAIVSWGIRYFFFGTSMPMYFSMGWVWDLIGLLVLLMIIRGILGWPWRHGLWSEERESRILRRRYARGEITEAQFKRMMKTLREND